jgi:hypothetical protein
MSESTSYYYIQRDIGAQPKAGTSSHIPAIPIRSVPTSGSSLPMQSSMNIVRAEHQYVFHPESHITPAQAQDIPASTSSAPPGTEPLKKKRGRPRKYGPEGPVGLPMEQLSASVKETSTGLGKRKGRPPGTGSKQQLAQLGGFSPELILSFLILLGVECGRYLIHCSLILVNYLHNYIILK